MSAEMEIDELQVSDDIIQWALGIAHIIREKIPVPIDDGPDAGLREYLHREFGLVPSDKQLYRMLDRAIAILDRDPTINAAVLLCAIKNELDGTTDRERAEWEASERIHGQLPRFAINPNKPKPN